MSLRAALVDDLKTVTAITNIVDDRIFDMFYIFEDFLNSKANAVSKFPAISIEADTYEPENNLDAHDNLIVGAFTITCYQQVNTSKFKSKSAEVRDREIATLREVDTLQDLVTSYLLDKRGALGIYTLRQPHIENISDGVFDSEDNREVITREISYSITYSKT